MIQGRNILCFASGYEAPPTCKHHIMHLLARDNQVLWVNYHASRRPGASVHDLRRVGAKLAQFAGGMQTPRENLHVLTPLVAPLPSAAWARGLNRRLLLWQIRRALGRLGRRPLQVWSFAPDVAYLLDGLEAEKTVYYCVDDFAHFQGYDSQQVLRDEELLARRADLVVTTSQELYDAKKSLNPRTILVTHGVDHKHFARALDESLAEPADLAAIARPRLGFFGLIRDWVDVPLLARVADLRPAWQFVLVGESAIDLSAFRRANLHFLGPRPYADLPAYCKGFDIGLVPFVVNDLTRAVNPIKLREYLSAGLGVISTPMPEAERLGPLVEVAASETEFIAAAERLLAAGPPLRAQRSVAMAGQTWERKLQQIAQELTP